MRASPSKPGPAALAALLAAANAFVCWKLFFTEYTNQMASIEGAFIAFARYTRDNFGDLTWFPLWFGGMPYHNVYGPVFHHAVAAAALAAGVSPALSFHALAAGGPDCCFPSSRPRRG
jgi:hypothetical protein